MGHRALLPRVSCVYRYDPYSTNPIIYEEEHFALPEDTLHVALEGKVSFMPYPTEKFYVEPAPLPKEAMARIFVGQLPYQVTDMQLNWLCHTFGRGAAVYFPERIVKHDQLRGVKLPTGCIHAYCDPEVVSDLMCGMHKRLLIDDTGVWYANTAKEQEALTEYTQAMKKDRSLRPVNRPYDTVVAQHATSTYVPPPPPPPSYNDFVGTQ